MFHIVELVRIYFSKITGCMVTHMRVRNFLTEPDRDIFIENKNVPYCRFSLNILKKNYRVRRYAHARAQLFKGAR